MYNKQHVVCILYVQQATIEIGSSEQLKIVPTKRINFISVSINVVNEAGKVR